MTPGFTNRVIFQLFVKKAPDSNPAFETDQLVADGEVLPLAGGIEIIHTPGHSAGHIAFYLQQDDVLIAGDICANIMGLALSTVYEDRSLGIDSIRKVAKRSFEMAVFGHGRPLMKDAAKRMRRVFSS